MTFNANHAAVWGKSGRRRAYNTDDVIHTVLDQPITLALTLTNLVQ